MFPVCLQDENLGDICTCWHMMEKFPVNATFKFKATPFNQHKTTFHLYFKRLFFSMFYFQMKSTSSSKSGGLSASFAALGICNSARSAWHAASGYAKFNWNWELKIPCSNELRDALKSLSSSSLQLGQMALKILPSSYLLQHDRNKHFPCPKTQPKCHLGDKTKG